MGFTVQCSLTIGRCIANPKLLLLLFPKQRFNLHITSSRSQSQALMIQYREFFSACVIQVCLYAHQQPKQSNQGAVMPCVMPLTDR